MGRPVEGKVPSEWVCTSVTVHTGIGVGSVGDGVGVGLGGISPV